MAQQMPLKTTREEAKKKPAVALRTPPTGYAHTKDIEEMGF